MARVPIISAPGYAVRSTQTHWWFARILHKPAGREGGQISLADGHIENLLAIEGTINQAVIPTQKGL